MRTETPANWYVWVLASRPKTLTGALIPVIMGCALAWQDNSFKWLPAILCCLFACMMQIAANFINDLYDCVKGSDGIDRLGPKRVCSQGWLTPDKMKIGIVVILFLACLVGSCLLFYGGWELVVIGLLCVAFAFGYTLWLSYLGYGDLLVLFFFGFIPLGGTYYVQTHGLSWDVFFSSLICGLVTDTLLVVNNYRDREQDALSGKRTLIVRFGDSFGRYLYLWLGITATLLSLWFVISGKLPMMSIIWSVCVYLVLHILSWRKMCRTQGMELNTVLGATSRNILLMGVLLSLAIVL